MSPSLIALLSTVVLLFMTLISIFASLPLLVLSHDTPRDSDFIRALFNFFYIAVMSAAAVAALGYGNFGRPAFALGMGGVMAYAFVVRRSVLSRMDALRVIHGRATRSRKRIPVPPRVSPRAPVLAM